MSKGQGEKFCLKWNDFEKNISSSFSELRNDEDFFDVTLACDDNQLQAHKVILSACSPFFRSVLKKNPHQHPLLYLKGIKYEDILSVLNFMYHGEVNVAQDDLNTFLSVAEDLQVKGLTQSQPNQHKIRQQPNAFKTNKIEERTSESNLDFISPKQPKRKSFYEQLATSSDKVGKRKEVEEFTPQIKTEAAVVLDCDEEPEDNHTHEVAQSGDYIEDQSGYEYDQSYQDQTMMYQAREMEMGQVVDSFQDPYGHIKQYVMKVPNENGFSCTICGKKCRDMYLMREHIEALHDMSPGYICGVCNQQCKNHKGLKVHMKRFHRN